MIIEKGTSLEIIDNDAKQTLDWKLKQLQDKNLPIESGLADYIEFGMSNIKSKIEQLTNYKDSILEEISKLKKFETDTSEKIAEWLSSQGIDKLKGINCSSITINKGSEAKEEKTKIFKWVWRDDESEEVELRTALSKLWELDFIKEIEIETTKIKPETKDKIKINSKRK